MLGPAIYQHLQQSGYLLATATPCRSGYNNYFHILTEPGWIQITIDETTAQLHLYHSANKYSHTINLTNPTSLQELENHLNAHRCTRRPTDP